ncbi:MAG: RNA polymerase sigma factor [Oscillospiraceae bacterium]|jgi:RNA polymerase sigma-70 factor (ECF subfamily)|nr:RNA polymerase sigma factor [Oscillospiraceae bacterium]
MDEFEEIVKTHQKRVYNICLRLCGDPDDAFDLSQEVFLKAWRGLEGFRGGSSVYTWLYRLAVNTCADFTRKKTRRGVMVSLDETDLPLPDARFEPSLALERKELARSLEEALKSLSPEHREILTLRETAELSYGEIARLLELEEGTVKSRLARARLALREMVIKTGNYSSQNTSNKREDKKKGGGRNGTL